MNAEKPPLENANVLKRVLIGLVVLAIGLAGLILLSKMKKPPAEVDIKESKVRVETVKVEPEDVQVFITGYGEVTALNTVKIASEVAGKIVRIHPRLEVGEIVKKGEVLFEIDKQDYIAAHDETLAAVAQRENTIVRLEKEYTISQSRLKTLLRNQELIKTDFERVKELLINKKIGTQSDVDAAERSYNAAVDQVAQMNQAVETYPLQIKETQYLLKSAKAKLAKTKANLKRCLVTAPFNGRMKEVNVEVGQYIAPGAGVVTLVDDSILEIHVPIDSVDARKWLRFDQRQENRINSWFADVQSVPVEIRWTEEQDGHTWEGKLHRILQYDKQTRTITAAIRVGNSVSKINGVLPLVEGMFCSVIIPGKTMHGIYRLPRWAVSFRNTVYISNDHRLKTKSVEVARIQSDEVFVKKGLVKGDNVIVTRLVDPLENSLLEIIGQQ